MSDNGVMVPWERVGPDEIWNFRQNHPELVVQDILKAFQLPDSAAEKIRNILMNRGVNKWLLARRMFIALKHTMKRFPAISGGYKKLGNREIALEYQRVYSEMQRICKMPRWVLWGSHAHRNMTQNDKEIVVLG